MTLRKANKSHYTSQEPNGEKTMSGVLVFEGKPGELQGKTRAEPNPHSAPDAMGFELSFQGLKAIGKIQLKHLY